MRAALVPWLYGQPPKHNPVAPLFLLGCGWENVVITFTVLFNLTKPWRGGLSQWYPSGASRKNWSPEKLHISCKVTLQEHEKIWVYIIIPVTDSEALLVKLFLSFLKILAMLTPPQPLQIWEISCRTRLKGEGRHVTWFWFFFFLTNWQRRVQGVIETRLLILRAIPTLLFTSYRDQTNVLTSVSLSFFIYRMGIIVVLILLPPAAAAAKSLQSCPTLCDPIDSSPLGSSVPGILQAGILEWVAISFSNAWK